MVDAAQLLLEVLGQYDDADKWLGQPFEKIKRLSNSKVGDVGQDFVELLCRAYGLIYAFPKGKDGRRLRQAPWDIRIAQTTFEVKTATEDVHGSFQFNHIRFHRKYEAVLCVGIGPSIILFDAWTKAEVVTGQAGNLVTMDKGSSATHKLTKRKHALRPIPHFEDHILEVVHRVEQEKGKSS